MALVNKEIGDLLVDNGLISAEQLQSVNIIQEKCAQPICQILTTLGLVSENQLKDTLELRYGVTYVALNKIRLDPKTIRLLRESVIKQHKVAPIMQEDDLIHLAMVNPEDQAALKDIKLQLASYRVKPMVCLEDDFARFVNFVFPEQLNLEQPSAKDALQGTILSKTSLPNRSDDKTLNSAEIVGDMVKALAHGQKAADTEDTIGHHADKNPPPNSSVTPEPNPIGETATGAKPMATINTSKPNVEPIEESEGNYTHDEDFLSVTAPSQKLDVSEIANEILSAAVKNQCTDVLIEGQSQGTVVRFLRGADILKEDRLLAILLDALVAQFKQFAGLDQMVTDIPQAKKLAMRVRDLDMKIRFATIPAGGTEMLAISLGYP